LKRTKEELDNLIKTIQDYKNQKKSKTQISIILNLPRSTIAYYWNPDRIQVYNDNKVKRHLEHIKRFEHTPPEPKVAFWRRRHKKGEGSILDSPICEICGKVNTMNRKLDWHHWNDEKPWQGLSVCARCHHFCEAIEHGLSHKDIDLYLKIKEERSK
jgi:hypothetical protein